MATKLICVSFFFVPLQSPRAEQVARLLSNSSYDVHLLTSVREEVPKTVYSHHYIQKSKIGVFSKIISLFTGIDLIFLWMARAFLKADEIIQKDDSVVIVTFGHPMISHFLGVLMKLKFKKLRFISHFSDPWSENPYILFLPGMKGLVCKFEQMVFKFSDRVIFTSMETLAVYESKVDKDVSSKFSVLNHCFSDFERLGEILTPKGKNGVLRIAHLGNFYRNRNPKLFIEAIKTIAIRNPSCLMNLTFEFYGRWRFRFLHLNSFFWKMRSLIQFKGVVNYQRSLSVMREVDVLLLIDAPSRDSVFFPSKLVDYISTGKPILAITSAGCSHRIVNMGFGKTIESSDFSVLCDELELALCEVRENRVKILNQNMEPFKVSNVVKAFDQMVAEQFVELNDVSR